MARRAKGFFGAQGGIAPPVGSIARSAAESAAPWVWQDSFIVPFFYSPYAANVSPLGGTLTTLTSQKSIEKLGRGYGSDINGLNQRAVFSSSAIDRSGISDLTFIAWFQYRFAAGQEGEALCGNSSANNDGIRAFARIPSATGDPARWRLPEAAGNVDINTDGGFFNEGDIIRFAGRLGNGSQDLEIYNATTGQTKINSASTSSSITFDEGDIHFCNSAGLNNSLVGRCFVAYLQLRRWTDAELDIDRADPFFYLRSRPILLPAHPRPGHVRRKGGRAHTSRVAPSAGEIARSAGESAAPWAWQGLHYAVAPSFQVGVSRAPLDEQGSVPIQPGVRGPEWTFTTGNRLRFPINPAPPSLPLTFFAVVRWDVSQDWPTARFFFTNGDTTIYAGFWVQKVGADDALQVSYGDGNSSSTGARRTKNSEIKLQAGQTHVIAAVVRGPQDMDLYIDGVEAGGTYSGSGDAYDPGSVPGYIGYDPDSGDYLDGAVAEAIIWEGDRTTTIHRLFADPFALFRKKAAAAPDLDTREHKRVYVHTTSKIAPAVGEIARSAAESASPGFWHEARFGWVASLYELDIVTGAKAINQYEAGELALKHSPHGSSIDLTPNAAGDYLEFPGNYTGGASRYTVAGLIKRNSNGDATFVSTTDTPLGDASGGVLDIRYDEAGFQTAGSDLFNIRFADQSAELADGLFTKDWLPFVVTWRGGDGATTLYLPGGEFSGTTGAGPLVSISGLRLGTGAKAPWDGLLATMFVSSRDWSPPEAAMYLGDPFSPFRRRPRIFPVRQERGIIVPDKTIQLTSDGTDADSRDPDGDGSAN